MGVLIVVITINTVFSNLNNIHLIKWFFRHISNNNTFYLTYVKWNIISVAAKKVSKCGHLVLGPM